MDDDDTWLGPAPTPDTEPGLVAVMLADTDEWEHTDREIEAQGTIDTDEQMFDDTGVVIINKPDEPANSEHLVVTFRQPSPVSFRQPRAPRASTADDWPPSPREPARAAPQMRERAFKNASVYAVVAHPENKN